MGPQRTKLGILTSAALSAGLLAGAAEAQTVQDFRLRPEDHNAERPPLAFQLYPLPSFDLSRDFSESVKRSEKPRVQIILPEKDYYKQRPEGGIELWDGATARMKGPLKVRITIRFP